MENIKQSEEIIEFLDIILELREQLDQAARSQSVIEANFNQHFQVFHLLFCGVFIAHSENPDNGFYFGIWLYF